MVTLRLVYIFIIDPLMIFFSNFKIKYDNRFWYTCYSWKSATHNNNHFKHIFNSIFVLPGIFRISFLSGVSRCRLEMLMVSFIKASRHLLLLTMLNATSLVKLIKYETPAQLPPLTFINVAHYVKILYYILVAVADGQV